MDQPNDSFINLVISIEVLTPLRNDVDADDIQYLEAQNAATIRNLASRDQEITNRAQVKGDAIPQAQLIDARAREAIAQMNAQERGYLFDLRDRVYYRRTPFDVPSYLLDLSIKELSTDTAWSGNMRIYDPAFVDVAINKLNFINAAGWDSHPSKMLIRFGVTPTDLDRGHTYSGFIKDVKLDLSEKGTFLDLSLVSDAIDWGDVNVNSKTSRISIKRDNDLLIPGYKREPYTSFTQAFLKVTQYALWANTFFDSGLDSVAIGEDFIMTEDETYLAFMKRIADKAHTDKGEAVYFHVYPPVPGGRPTYFFGSASYARKMGLTGFEGDDVNDSAHFSFGSPDSNVIEARVDSNKLVAAIKGANQAIFRPYDLGRGEFGHAYYVVGGIPKKLTTAEANAIIGNVENKTRIIEIPMYAQNSEESAANNVYAYINSLKRASLEVSLTVLGSHAVKILDVIQFDYYTTANMSSMVNPVSGRYLCLGVQHDIDQNRGWVTTYRLQRDNVATASVDSEDASGTSIVTPKNLQGVKQDILDQGKKNDDAVKIMAEMQSLGIIPKHTPKTVSP